MTPAGGWRWFWAWALSGGLLVFAFLTGFSIGLFVLPLAVVVIVLVARRARGWPEGLGVLTGAAAVCLSIGGRQLADRAAGGFDPVPWIVAGAVLALAGVGGYRAARRHVLPSSGPGLSTGETIAVTLALFVTALGLTLFFSGLGSSEDVEVATVTLGPP